MEKPKIYNIDAYSEVLDALIEAKSELIHLYGILDIKGEETYNVKNINKALKKAGCHE